MSITLATYACTRCGRALKRASDTGMGPKCASAVLGPQAGQRAKRERAQAPIRDRLTKDMFEGAIA